MNEVSSSGSVIVPSYVPSVTVPSVTIQANKEDIDLSIVLHYWLDCRPFRYKRVQRQAEAWLKVKNL